MDDSEIIKECAFMGSIGMPEMLVILVIALIIFGPRKLPELGQVARQEPGRVQARQQRSEEYAGGRDQNRRAADIPARHSARRARHGAAGAGRGAGAPRRPRRVGAEVMAVVPFPDPQSSKDSSARDESDVARRRPGTRRRQDVLPGAPGRAPEAADLLPDFPRRRRRDGGLFLERIYEFVMRPMQAMLPPGGQAHLHRAVRSLHAVPRGLPSSQAW